MVCVFFDADGCQGFDEPEEPISHHQTCLGASQKVIDWGGWRGQQHAQGSDFNVDVVIFTVPC